MDRREFINFVEKQFEQESVPQTLQDVQAALQRIVSDMEDSNQKIIYKAAAVILEESLFQILGLRPIA